MVIKYTSVFSAVIIDFHSQDVQPCSIVIQLHDQMTTYLQKKKKNIIDMISPVPMPGPNLQ